MYKLFLFLLLLLCCCSTKREGRVYERSEARSDVVLRDTFTGQYRYNGLQHKKVMIRQVLLSPPDTFDKQYVQTITDMVAVDEHAYQGESAVENVATAQAVSRREDETLNAVKQQTKAGGGVSWPLWLAVGGGIVVLFVYRLGDRR